MQLTLEQIEQRISDIESRYYKGKRSDEFWKLSDEVEPYDRNLWLKYNQMKNKKLRGQRL
tara:strand:- start:391 stop:570 length:180 start_codon:yes stop_codon:yes gene_type:complete